jgi:hypothetical protein
MRKQLVLYFEFAFKLDVSVREELVAITNELSMEVADESISDERLLAIYCGAIANMAKQPEVLHNFCLLPTLFLRDDSNLPMGEIWDA